MKSPVPSEPEAFFGFLGLLAAFFLAAFGNGNF